MKSGDPGVMDGMLGSRRGLVGTGIFTYLPFRTMQKLSLRWVVAM